MHYYSSREKHSGRWWTEDIGLRRGQVIESLIFTFRDSPPNINEHIINYGLHLLFQMSSASFSTGIQNFLLYLSQHLAQCQTVK